MGLHGLFYGELYLYLHLINAFPHLRSIPLSLTLSKPQFKFPTSYL